MAGPIIRTEHLHVFSAQSKRSMISHWRACGNSLGFLGPMALENNYYPSPAWSVGTNPGSGLCAGLDTRTQADEIRARI